MNEEYRQFRNRRVLSGAAKWKDLRLFLLVEERRWFRVLIFLFFLLFLKKTCKIVWKRIINCIFANEKLKTKRMKDYIDKINNSKDATSVAQEPALAITVCQPKKSAEKRLEASMPCYFSEGELDEEIRVSMKSGNATQREVDAVFCR